MLIYYAEHEPTQDPDSINTFVGIFSTSALAEKACQDDWNERQGNARTLLWIGWGDSLQAGCRDGIYVIMPLELDRRMEYAPLPKPFNRDGQNGD